MNNQRMIIIHQFIVWFFSLAILSHNVVEPPVLCLDDEHINIEKSCRTGLLTVNHYIETNEGSQDDCLNCVDIPIEIYNPDLAFMVKSVNYNPVVFHINSTLPFRGELQESITSHNLPDLPQNHIPPLLKSTVLII